MESKPREFIPQDTVKAAVNGSLLLGGAGLAVSAIQNALVKRNIGPWGVFTRSGGIIVVFGSLNWIVHEKYEVVLISWQLRLEVPMNLRDAHLRTCGKGTTA